MLLPEYLAGLFDGEGNVEITNKHALRVGLGNTYKDIVYWIKDQYGGSITITNPGKGRRAHHKVGYMWRACGTNARRFLEDILPYTHIKREQIKLGLKIQVHKRGVKYTDNEHVEREKLRTNIQELNRRGVRWGEVEKYKGEQ